MRSKAAAFILIFALGLIRASQSGALDSEPPPSAYEILGVSPAGQAATVPLAIPKVPVQASGVDNTPASTGSTGSTAEVSGTVETVDTAATATTGEAGGTADATIEATSGDAADDASADAEPSATDSAATQATVDAAAPATTDTIAPATVAPTDAAPAGAEPASPDAGWTPDPDASDEQVLMDEIVRLMAERDSLYQAINDLKAENDSLTEAAAATAEDTAFYRELAASLQAEVSRLEAELATKNEAIADADARLSEMASALGQEQTGRLTAETGRADAISERDAARADLASADTARRNAEARLAESEALRASAEAALAAAAASGGIIPVPTLDASTGTKAGSAPVSAASGTAGGPTPVGFLAGWSIDTSRFGTRIRNGFEGSLPRIGSWRVAGDIATQTDASQYFSRLEMPLAQKDKAMLYRFYAKSGGTGWAGIGLHIFVENVQKKRGYGEGRSLLVWFTRDRAARGDDATYLQVYRSDTDVVMERMLDAELETGLERWRLVEVAYDPVAEYIAVAVDGQLKAVYKTFFGRDSGATVSLRTLGGGNSFKAFSVWTE